MRKRRMSRMRTRHPGYSSPVRRERRRTSTDSRFRASNLSSEETRISEAPAARRRSIDSQKTSSSMAVWTATQPSTARGMIVGDLSPGTTCADGRKGRDRGVHHDILVAAGGPDGADAHQQAIDVGRVVRGRPSSRRLATRTACDSRIVTIWRRSLRIRVDPVAVNSTIASARPRAGATSTEPLRS